MTERTLRISEPGRRDITFFAYGYVWLEPPTSWLVSVKAVGQVRAVGGFLTERGRRTMKPYGVWPGERVEFL